MLPRFFGPDELAEAAREIQELTGTPGVRVKGGLYAVRDLLRLSSRARVLARCSKVNTIVSEVLGGPVFAVRGMLFDKIPTANWVVPWPQDLTICVKSKRDIPGFGPWTRKAGVVHVQPPVEVLDRMLSVRIHLDDAAEENGALRVFPGTHRKGRLSAAQILDLQRDVKPEICSVPRGGLLLMKPLLLHASSAAKTPEHRRVIHLEFASCELPEGLEWQESPGQDSGSDMLD